MRRLAFPHPLVLLVAGILLAATLTWIVPAGQYARREDAATGHTVVVAGTYHRVAALLRSWTRPARCGAPWTGSRGICKTGARS
jgi:uncharacterized ion transporter superfamily protein YfcC